MRRRTALELAAGFSAIASAGCLGDGSSGGSENGDEPANGALYTVSIDSLEEPPAEELPLELGFDVGRETITQDAPFGIEFELRNEGEEPIEISSGAPWPFGVVWMEREGAHDEPGVTLWTNAYEESGHVRTEGRRAVEVEDIGLVEEVTGGESVRETYELHHDTPELVTGTYRFSVVVGARAGEISNGVSLDFEPHDRRKSGFGTGHAGLTEPVRTKRRFRRATSLSRRR